MPYLLVNADDFGLHPDIDCGILDCINAGVVQSISFSPNGKSLDWNKLTEMTQAGVRAGLHVTLVGEPWLTDGRIVRNWKSLVGQIMTGGKGFRTQVADEVSAQLLACRDHGIYLSHIDSHQHIHVFPGVWEPCFAVAKLLGIRIRIPRVASTSAVKKNLAGLGLQTLAAIRSKAVEQYLPCLGLALAGHNTADVLMKELSESSNAGDLELVAHPGRNTKALERAYGDWNFDWTGERDALLDPRLREKINELRYTFMPVP